MVKVERNMTANSAGQENFDFLEVKVCPNHVDLPCGAGHIDFVGDAGEHPTLTILETEPDRAFCANAELVTLFGFKPEQLQRSLKIISGPLTDMKSFMDLRKRAFSGQETECLFTFYKRNGDETACQVQASPIMIEGSRAIRLSMLVVSRQTGLTNICLEPPIGKCFCESKSDPFLFLNLDDPTPTEIDPAVMIHIRAVRAAALTSRYGQLS
jgi:hypothetical protein